MRGMKSFSTKSELTSSYHGTDEAGRLFGGHRSGHMCIYLVNFLRQPSTLCVLEGLSHPLDASSGPTPFLWWIALM